MALLPGELEALQAAMLEIYDLTADIQHNTSSTVVIGQKTETWQSILPGGAPIACLMEEPSKAIAAQYASLIGTMQSTVISFDAVLTTDPQRGDRVVVQGQTWTVQALLHPESYTVSTDLLCTRIS